MRRRTIRVACVLVTAAIATLMWPGPSSADTSLGGYSATAQAEPIRLQIYEPVIPIPSTPQIDAGIGYTKSSTDTGPVSRATASYLWPGDVIGDGFNQLVGSPNAKYTVQVNSRNPPTSDAPAKNTMQLTDGNGMTTSSSDTTTTADVTGLGITGTNVLSNPLSGLQNLIPGTHKAPKPLSLPLPVSDKLAGIVNIGNLKSDSDVVLGKNSVTATAHATMSSIKLLGGLLSISAFDLTSKTVSDGKKATVTGAFTIGSLSVLGQTIALDDKGIELAGQKVALPVLPDLLSTLGITIKYLQSTKSVVGATGSLSATGMEITVDTAPLKNLLHLSKLTAPLEALLEKIPKLGSQLGALTQIGPKIVLDIGYVTSSATASPAFASGGVVPPVSGGLPGTGSGGGTIGTPIGPGVAIGTQTPPPVSNPGTVNPPPTTQAVALHLPALGTMPRVLILGALVLAALMAWLLRAAAGALFGTGANCNFGLATGVPDLRKG
jgi:hypothetical protein